MTGTQLFALSPFITLAGTICILLIAIAWWRNFLVSCVISVAGLAATLMALLAVTPTAPIAVTPLISVDGFGITYAFLVVLASLCVTILSWDYFRHRETLQDEYYVLLLSATLGGMTLVFSTHFGSFVLGLELLGISLYAMIGYSKQGLMSLEAALKYLILSGVSSAFILFGIALSYAVTGTLELAEVAALPVDDRFLMAGLSMLFAGIMFKLSLVPFHMWTPDVYQGAPAPVTAFVATVSKGAIFSVLLRFLMASGLHENALVLSALAVVAALSMVIGNLLALLQNDVKRILAYSSIAHLGYLLVALIAAGSAATLSVESCTWFLIAYFITTLAAFGIVTIMSTPGSGDDEADLESYLGLFWRKPTLAASFSAALLSLAGIPLTVGFIGKFYVFAAGTASNLWWLLIVLIVGSGIGLFYYLRIIFTMTQRPRETVPVITVPLAGGWVVASLALILLVLGVWPTPVVDLVTTMLYSS